MTKKGSAVTVTPAFDGLEEEHDSLPGLIMALGHEPVRFEDFTAQPVPSREACLKGVESADLYLLLLGPHYGQPLPETGKSPHTKSSSSHIEGASHGS
jgi:hypothetical protein